MILGARLTGRFGVTQWTNVTLTVVLNQSGAIEESILEHYRQPCLADGCPVRAELAGFVSAPLRERCGGEALTAVSMEVLVDIEGVESGIEGAELGAEAEATLHIGHQRKEVGDIRLIERSGEFGQDKFAPAGDFGGHYTPEA
jgi:hypothetical protein